MASVPGALAAQEPEGPPPVPPDTIVRDTLPRDTLPDGPAPPPDQPVAADTILEEPPPPPRFLPELPRPVPAALATGVWEWDRQALLAVRALTITELLSEIPGVIPIRGGSYGFPEGVSAFGAGGGRVRIFMDDFEMAPMEGGLVDLSRVSLGTIERVRVERHPGELRVELFTLKLLDSRPYTFIHVATGDLNTNLFRGLFQHPRVLGGVLAVGLDRLDTQGINRQEPGSSAGTWLRYSWVPVDRGGLEFEFRSNGAERLAALYPPGELSRTDIVLRGRFRLAEGVLANAFWGRASLSGDDPEPGELADILFHRRSQLGVGLRAERDAPAALPIDLTYWGGAAFRLQQGDGWAENVSELRGGVRGGFGGFEAAHEREGWGDAGSAGATRLRAWSPTLFGLSVFGSWENAWRGVPWHARIPVPPDPDEDPDAPPPPTWTPDPIDPLFTQRTSIRLGASFERGALSLGVAGIRMEADLLAPLGMAAEREGEFAGEGERPRDGLVLPGGERTGFEVTGNIPLPLLDGLFLVGSAHFWDADEIWRYLPRRSYNARVSFHDTFLPTGNLEVWADVGVRGRDPMAIPLPGEGMNPWLDTGLEVVPFDQSWFARLQIRVVTVRVFVDWENVTMRRENQDFPGRRMPATRTMYGVRWNLWN